MDMATVVLLHKKLKERLKKQSNKNGKGAVQGRAASLPSGVQMPKPGQSVPNTVA